MSCYLPKISLQMINCSFQCQPATKPNFLLSYPFSTKLHQFHHSSSLFLQPFSSRTKPIRNFHVHSSLTTPSPPLSKEEAIVQAKTCLSAALEKPLNNPKLPGKLKKLKQPRLRVEIPIVDDSPSSLSNLAFQVFGDIPIRRKGSAVVKVLIIWSNFTLAEAASKKFDNLSSNLAVENRDLPSISNNGDSRALNSSDVVVFMLPEASELGIVKIVTDRAYPKATVIFNPKWGFEEEGDLKEDRGFVGSFEVVYSFMGLEVRGLLSKRKGVIFKCARDGIMSGERWNILMEDEEEGGMKVVSQLKTRPSIAEVENVLYNVMAINSPITKSAKFFKNLLSNVTGKK